DTPMIDVRAPVEFAQTALPAAQNLPILNDDEREQVGICYKNDGQAAATALGHRLVSGETKARRIQGWVAFVQNHPNALLFCARGGMRSKLATQWLKDAGYSMTRIEGGYKQIRQLLVEQYSVDPARLLILAGSTGVGKTEVLVQDPIHIDLEGLANHRGSAFGTRVTVQPAQTVFENGLGVQLLKWQSAGSDLLLLEDEGRLIGRLHLPPPLQAAMKAAPLVVLEASFEARALRIHQDYILDNWRRFEGVHGDDAFEKFSEYLLQALNSIKKRLGGIGFETCQNKLTDALALQSLGDTSGHLGWIEYLLVNYYDPMYTYQLNQKAERIVFRGDAAEIRDYLVEVRKKHALNF
ncbi:MAG: tRNA 2-selenouridine(34) synthase MnmH, partial [Pseudomonadales bacterium]